MCYSDETCTTTCPSSRRRREAQRALGIYRRETVDGVEIQDNGLPGKYNNQINISAMYRVHQKSQFFEHE